MAMKTTFDPGDPVYWSIDIQVGEDITTATIDAKIIEVNREHNIALIGYHLQSAGHKQAWVSVAKLTSKVYIAPTEAELFSKAKQKFSDSVWDAPVIWDESYYDDVEEAKEAIFYEWSQDDAPNPDDLPEFVWAAKASIEQPYSVVDRFVENLEEIYDGLSEEHRSRQAIQVLTEAEKKAIEIMGEIRVWDTDYSIAVSLDWDNLLHDFDQENVA